MSKGSGIIKVKTKKTVTTLSRESNSSVVSKLSDMSYNDLHSYKMKMQEKFASLEKDIQWQKAHPIARTTVDRWGDRVRRNISDVERDKRYYEAKKTKFKQVKEELKLIEKELKQSKRKEEYIAANNKKGIDAARKYLSEFKENITRMNTTLKNAQEAKKALENGANYISGSVASYKEKIREIRHTIDTMKQAKKKVEENIALYERNKKNNKTERIDWDWSLGIDWIIE